jgi:hypothetical protein
MVDGRYVYESELDLEIGDEVLLPAGFSGDWVGRVTALSSDYPGPCKRILGLVRRRSDVERRDAVLASVAIASSTTCRRVFTGYLLGIASASLGAGGFQMRGSTKAGVDQQPLPRL